MTRMLASIAALLLVSCSFFQSNHDTAEEPSLSETSLPPQSLGEEDQPELPSEEKPVVSASSSSENPEEDPVPPEPSPPQPLEQLPAELSLAYLSAMRLEGKDLVLEEILEEKSTYTRHAISYRSNGLLISGILNIPKGDGPFPLLILNHGYIDRAVYVRGRGLRREQDFLARQGFAVLHTDYRGHAASDPSPDTRKVYDAGLEYAMDSMNAILAVREAKLPAINAERIGMLGHSLGGGVTLNVAVSHPDLVSAVVLYAPVHSDAYENFLRWRKERASDDRTAEVLRTREENPAGWNALSSLTFLERITDPVLLFHGTADKDVPYAWSVFLEEKLRSLEKNITFVTYESEGHEFGPRWQDFMEQTAAFFKEHL